MHDPAYLSTTTSEHPSVAAAAAILERAKNPVLRDLIRYWLAIHPRSRLPARRDFDPVAVPHALKSLVLVDVERDPFRFKVRLMGTSVVTAFERDFTGRYMDETFPDMTVSPSHTQRVQVAETELPVYRTERPTLTFKLNFAPVEGVHLPFASDGRTVDMILTMTVYMSNAIPPMNWAG